MKVYASYRLGETLGSAVTHARNFQSGFADVPAWWLSLGMKLTKFNMHVSGSAVRYGSRRILYGLDVIHTPTRVITSPLSIINVRGSENSIHAHSIVTGGLR